MQQSNSPQTECTEEDREDNEGSQIRRESPDEDTRERGSKARECNDESKRRMVGEPSEEEESGDRRSVHDTQQQRTVLRTEVDVGSEGCENLQSDRVDVGSLELTWNPDTRNETSQTVQQDRSREGVESRPL